MKTNLSTRRHFLKSGAGIAAASAFLPGLSLSNPRPERPRSLVLIELKGGLDGLTAVVPYEDELYYRARPKLAVSREKLLPFDDRRAFPAEMQGVHGLWKSERMGLIESVGYRGASMSHFKAAGVLHSALSDDRVTRDGWISRLRDHLWPDDARPELITHIGKNAPASIHSRKQPPLMFESPASLLRVERGAESSVVEASAKDEEKEDESGVLGRIRGTMRSSAELGPRILEITSEYEPKVEYPKGDLGTSLHSVAALMEAGFGACVYSISHEGFDAHSSGCGCTTDALGKFSRGLEAFQADIAGRSAAGDCVVVAYSEFGRRVVENASGGTDHGAAGPMWIFGEKVVSGLHGAPPSLSDLDGNGNLKFNIDFRRVYAAIIDQWLGGEHELVLGKQYAALDLFRS